MEEIANILDWPRGVKDVTASQDSFASTLAAQTTYSQKTIPHLYQYQE